MAQLNVEKGVSFALDGVRGYRPSDIQIAGQSVDGGAPVSQHVVVKQE